MRAAFGNSRNKAGEGHAKKYSPGQDPLEEEAKLDVIQPSSANEQKQLLKLVKQLLANTRNPKERDAMLMWKANLKTEQLKGVAQQQFVRDFWGWLIGRGSQKDHDKTPWGRQSLADDPSVAAYIDAFISKLYEYQVKLALLAHRRPIGINQCYLFFKYIVRAEPLNQTNFLKDWQILLSEFQTARDKDQQDYVDKDEYPHPHEMAPYGKVRQEMANARYVAEQKKGPDVGHDSDGDDPVSSEEENPPPPPRNPPPPNGLPPGNDDAMSLSSSDEDDDDVDQQPQELASTIEALANAVENLNGRLSNELSPERRSAVADKTIAEAQRIAQQQEERIRQLQLEVNNLRQAKQPADKSLANLEEAQKTRDQMAGYVEESRAIQKALLQEIINLQKSRAKEQQELTEALKKMPGPALPAADSKLLESMNTFQTQLAGFMKKNEARLQQIEGNLAAGAGARGPMIEELNALTNTWRQLGEDLKRVPEKLQQITWKSDADESAARAQALALVAQHDKSADIIRGIQAAQDRQDMMMKKLMEGFDKGFNAMLQSLRQNDIRGYLEQQTKVIGEIIEKTPVANRQLMLEWHNAMKKDMEQRLVVAEQTRNVPAEQLSEALKALKEQADQNNKMIQWFHHLAQTQEEQAKTLRLAESAYSNLKGAAQNEVALLSRQQQQARQQAQQQENMMRQMMQRMYDQHQQIGYLANLNRQQAEAYQRERFERERRFAVERRNMQEFLQNLQNNLPRLMGPEEGPEAMDLDEDGDEFKNLSEGERWLLRLEGSPPPLLLEGPQGQKTELKRGDSKPEKAKQVLPEYTQADMAKIRDRDHKELFDQVRRLEQGILNAANTYGKELGPETAHVFSVKSVNKAVLKNKIERYRQLLTQWGLSTE